MADAAQRVAVVTIRPGSRPLPPAADPLQPPSADRRREAIRCRKRRFAGIVPLMLFGALSAITLGAGGARAGATFERIETLAGGGSVGDGGPATSARFNLPGGVTEAPNSDLVVVDFGNHRIRRIDHLTGAIETIAGTGEAGYNGDGIRASSAQLSRPEQAVFGPDGDLFIADSYNNRIRRADHRTGLISTVAGTGERGGGGDGGPATAAELHFPEGLAVDRSGNIFISDTVNRRIRRVDAKTGVIETYAGTGAVGLSADGAPARQAQFLRLARIAVDPAGNLYVADSPAHRIYVIDAATRTIRTFAGDGSLGFSGDGGPAGAARLSYPEGVMAAANGDVYFADVANHRVRRIEAATDRITTVAGTGEKGFSGDGGPASQARLWSPGRVWLDHSGNLLIVDILNARIRRVDADTGLIATIAGTGDWGDHGPAEDAILSVPGDLVYAAGKIFFADYGTRRIRCVDLKTRIITTVAGGGLRSGDGIAATETELALPEGLAVDPRGTLYIADNILNRVMQVDLNTGIIRSLAGGGTEEARDQSVGRKVHLSMPSAMAVAPDGLLYFAEFGGQKMWAVDPASGTMRNLPILGSGRAASDAAVTSIDIGPDGLYFLTHGSNTVRRVDLKGGQPLSLPAIDGLPMAPSGDSQIIDVAVRKNRVYLADALAHRVLVIDLDTSKVRVIAGSGEQGFKGDGGAADQARLFQPGGVAVSDDGRELYIADTKNHRIRRVYLREDDERAR
jgi:trimeric autotransporter adhesin